MPLHDWTDDSGWDGFHTLWIAHLFHAIKPRLPGEFRAYLGSIPTVHLAGPEKPDVAVRHWLAEPSPDAANTGNGAADLSSAAPDIETATITLDPQLALYIAYRGRLVAAIELNSPRNKDRPSAREHYAARYLGYLREGAHLLLVDVLPRPRSFSFADVLAAELHVEQPATPPPHAVTYRVGEPAAEGGRYVALWRRPLAVGAPLPTMPLPLTVHAAIDLDLETTYMQAAADAYMA